MVPVPFTILAAPAAARFPASPAAAWVTPLPDLSGSDGPELDGHAAALAAQLLSLLYADLADQAQQIADVQRSLRNAR